MLDILDFDELERKRHALLSAPAVILRDKGEVAKLREQRKQLQQVQQTIEAATGAGNAMEALGKGATAINEDTMNEPKAAP